MTTQKNLDFARMMLQCLIDADAVTGRKEAEEMIHELENEIAWSAAKKNGRITEKQRTRAMEKFLSVNEQRNPHLCVAFPMTKAELPSALWDYVGKFGYVQGAALIITDPVIGIPEPEKSEPTPHVFSRGLLVFSNLTYHEMENFDPATVSVHLANEKARLKSYGRWSDKRAMPFTLENGEPYGLNAEFLSQIITVLGGEDIKLFLPEEAHQGAKIESPRGIAFLLPVRMK